MRFIHAVWVPSSNVSYTYFALARAIIGVAVVRPGAMNALRKGPGYAAVAAWASPDSRATGSARRASRARDKRERTVPVGVPIIRAAFW